VLRVGPDVHARPSGESTVPPSQHEKLGTRHRPQIHCLPTFPDCQSDDQFPFSSARPRQRQGLEGDRAFAEVTRCVRCVDRRKTGLHSILHFSFPACAIRKPYEEDFRMAKGCLAPSRDAAFLWQTHTSRAAGGIRVN
jgi:hypothetical protein